MPRPSAVATTTMVELASPAACGHTILPPMHFTAIKIVLLCFLLAPVYSVEDNPADDQVLKSEMPPAETELVLPTAVARALEKHSDTLDKAREDYIEEVIEANERALKHINKAIAKAEKENDATLLQALTEQQQAIKNIIHLDVFGNVIDKKRPIKIKKTQNVALASAGAQAKASGSAAMLIDGNSTEYTPNLGFARGYCPCTFEVTLKDIYELNHIRILLWDGDNRSYRYAVETSIDGKTYHPLVDYSNENRQSWQELRFKPRNIKHIRVLGVHNTANSGFHIVEIEAYRR